MRVFAEAVVVVVVVVMAVVSTKSQDLDVGSFPSDNTAAMDSWIARLYTDKLKIYNRNARPVTDHTHPTTVTLGLSLKNIHLDDEKQELSVNAWTVMTWKDEFLHWSPQDYMNIDRLHFDNTDIWLPDITIYNSAEGSDVHPFGSVPVLVEASGQAYWFPPTHITVKCNLDLAEWPRDRHLCMVRLGSWSHHGEQIDIKVLSQNGSEGVMTDTLEVNSRWDLVNATATRSHTNIDGHDPYIEVNFAFWVQRQARTQALYITQSTLAVVVVVLLTYILPIHMVLSRLLMHLFALGVLIICFFALFALLPTSGGPVPFVVLYYSGSIVLTTLSLLSTLCLTTRPCCCCCCGGSSSSSSSSSSLGKTLVSMATSPFRRGGVTVPQASFSTGSPYSHLENEVTVEEDDELRRPRATQLNQVGGSSQYINLQEAATQGGGHVDRITHSQFIQVINYLLMMLFGIAFVVDYFMLRNATL